MFDFWHLSINPILKSQQFPLSMMIFRKNLSNFVTPVWKLHNPYCHSPDVKKLSMYLVPDEVVAWSFGSTSPIVDVTAAVWVFNELKTRRYCFKFRQRYESIFLVAASSLTQAILTVAFHRKLESEPFFTAKTSCLPFVSKKWLEISFNSVMEDKNPSYEILDTCCNERVWRNTSPCKKNIT